jgi:hypothetical protein
LFHRHPVTGGKPDDQMTAHGYAEAMIGSWLLLT